MAPVNDEIYLLPTQLYRELNKPYPEMQTRLLFQDEHLASQDQDFHAM